MTDSPEERAREYTRRFVEEMDALGMPSPTAERVFTGLLTEALREAAPQWRDIGEAPRDAELQNERLAVAYGMSEGDPGYTEDQMCCMFVRWVFGRFVPAQPTGRYFRSFYPSCYYALPAPPEKADQGE